MENHIVKILTTDFVTHNVKRFVVEKPAGFTYIAGQATEISINKPVLENELRPFTFTSLNESDHLEFIIKGYTGHNGVTEKLHELKPGDELIIHDVFGTISYHGPGLFIAGGAGITPFIAIFRQLKLENKLPGNTLLFANSTADDTILHDELKAMLGAGLINVLEITNGAGEKKVFIDKDLLKQHFTGDEQYFYVCGPDKFVSTIIENLVELGIKESKIIIEK